LNAKETVPKIAKRERLVWMTMRMRGFVATRRIESRTLTRVDQIITEIVMISSHINA